MIRDSLCQAQGSWEAVAYLLSSWVKNMRMCLSAAYEFFRPKGRRVMWASIVWHPSLIPKHAFIVWLCVKDRILTRDKLNLLDINRGCVHFVVWWRSPAGTCTSSASSWQMFGDISEAGWASLGVCPPFLMLSNSSRGRLVVPIGKASLKEM